MDIKPLQVPERAYSSSKSIQPMMEELDVPKSPSSAGIKKKRRFAGLTINVRKSKFIPKKKLSLEEKFDIQGVLGAGAYSCVKSAVEKATELRVAIKTCHGSNGREMLTSEYSILRRLDNPHIIKVYDLLEDDASDESHMTMEHFASTSLDDYITECGIFTETEAQQIMRQLLETINYLHENGITHCDIKPENILYNAPTKEIKLIDFNISKSKCESELSPEDNSDTKSDSGISNFSANLSSPLYAAPEMRKCRHSQAVDLWGAGIVLFTLVLGRMKSFGLHKIKDLEERSEEMTNIIEQNNKVSDATKLFLNQLLHKEAEGRLSARDALSNSWVTETDL